SFSGYNKQSITVSFSGGCAFLSALFAASRQRLISRPYTDLIHNLFRVTMQLTGLLDLLRGSTVYRDFIEQLHTDAATDDLRVIRAARPFVLAALARDWDGPVIYVTARVDRAYNVAEQLPVWLAERPIHRFAEPTP